MYIDLETFLDAQVLPTRLTESFNEGIYNTKPFDGRANLL